MSAPAGWYPEGNGQRYWDGSAWTEHRAPLFTAQPWSGLSVTAFISGVMGIALYFFPPASILLAVIAVVFMFLGLREVKVRSARGTVLAVFGGVLGLLTLQFMAFMLVSSGSG